MNLNWVEIDFPIGQIECMSITPHHEHKYKISNKNVNKMQSKVIEFANQIEHSLEYLLGCFWIFDLNEIRIEKVALFSAVWNNNSSSIAYLRKLDFSFHFNTILHKSIYTMSIRSSFSDHSITSKLLQDYSR